MPKLLLTTLTLLLLLSTQATAKEEREVPGMKCGAGKCGANMFDGNAALGKKKKNILSQMRDDDSRKDCVIKAATTKAVYDCVRDPKGKKLTTKCGTGKCGSAPMKCGAGKCGSSMNNTTPEKKPAMKCGAGKCGSSMKTIEAEKKIEKQNSMKCGAGKCGDSMKSIRLEKKTKKESTMKCGAGKCGDSMKKEILIKEPTMKCGAGKCGSSM